MRVNIPHCQNKQVAQSLVEAVKYPLVGYREVAGRSLALSDKSVSDYVQGANKETLLIVMIEYPEK
jgi:2-keto-3-deoxy-L-rhamnonate aldolase RhmA